MLFEIPIHQASKVNRNMTTQAIANQLVKFCKTGQWEKAQNELYAENAVSIEPAGGPWPEKVEGLAALKIKGEKFSEMVEEIHGFEVSEPIIAGNFFSITMTIDSTMKGMGRSKSPEICVYEVRDGKIVLEQFFYNNPA